MKLFLKIFAISVISLGVGVFVAYAQSYTPIAPLPGTFTGAEGSETTNMALYLSGLLKLLIALGAALAILFAIIGGTQYVAASINPSAKADALEKVQNALIGLAIILTSYLLLNSINPNLVRFDFILPPVGTTPLLQYQQSGGDISTWHSDTTERTALLPVTINKSNCVNIGDSNCTSVSGLAPDVISKIKAFQVLCNCSVVITGGTENWLHHSHNNNRRVDLSKGTVIDSYINKTGTETGTACGVPSDRRYQVNGAIYVDEPNRDGNGNITGTGRHWHVCY